MGFSVATTPHQVASWSAAFTQAQLMLWLGMAWYG